jgi:23S rRNA pseudouridine1911/1915/1917 synthase
MRKAPQYSSGLTVIAVGKDEPKILRDFLALKFSLTGRTAKAVIDGRSVWVNRKCVWMAKYVLKTGDLIEIPSRVVKAAQNQCKKTASQNTSSDNKIESESVRHIRVLWSDDNYLAADKPSGVLSCDDPKSAEAILREQENCPGLKAVHRLDRDTTGCIIFAKSKSAYLAAVDTFKTRSVQKIYHAITLGKLKFTHITVDTPLDGDKAISRVTRMASSEDASFVSVKIETGRTNQIRRHLSSIRYPIIGDRVFGRKNISDPRMMQVTRQMLHASTISMKHPLQPKTLLKVHSPLPADFRRALKLFNMGNGK